jgi:hypothetical protein
MQQNEYTEKFVQLWNDQAIDSHHDIIVSVDYALYNINDIPSCGFCIALFESINDKPRGGGKGYSLAYTPNENYGSCQYNNGVGLEAAIYGIGFDINGIFAKKTPYVDGVENTTSNSICLRDGIKNDYKVIKQSENLQFSKNFQIAQQFLPSEKNIEYKQIRVVFSHCSSLLRIEGKNDKEKDFSELFRTNLPIKEKKSLKIGLFYTSLDQNSRFLLRQFNVAGFPSKIEEKINTDCYQEIKTGNNLIGNKLPSNNKWIAANANNGFDIYKYNGKEYTKSQEIRSTNPITILNYKEDLLLCKSNNKLLVYEFKGNKVVKQNTITLPTTADITSSAIYKDTLVVSSSSVGEQYYVYNYIRESSNLSELGTWGFYQTFSYPLCSGFGTNIEMSENYLLSYSLDNFVISFKKDPNFGYQYHQTIVPPFTSAKGFGYSMSIQNDNEMIVGAPFGEKRYIGGNNQGEVFHYVLSPNTGQWVLVSEIGGYFNMDTLSGAFGYSVKIDGNRAAISAPYETFYLNDFPLLEVSNQGKVYLLEKDNFGYFTNRKIYYPNVILGDSEKNYGKSVNVFNNILTVSIPFSESIQNDSIVVYNLDCPPLSSVLLKPTPTATPVPTPTPTLTPFLSPTPNPTPTVTPSVTPTNVVLGLGIVTLVDGIQITEIEGDDLYPLKGIITFTDLQMESFNNEDLNPF